MRNCHDNKEQHKKVELSTPPWSIWGYNIVGVAVVVVCTAPVVVLPGPDNMSPRFNLPALPAFVSLYREFTVPLYRPPRKSPFDGLQAHWIGLQGLLGAPKCSLSQPGSQQQPWWKRSTVALRRPGISLCPVRDHEWSCSGFIQPPLISCRSRVELQCW